MAEVQLTESGRKELEERLEYLKSVRRAEIAEEIKIARGFGDLSENADYDAARDRQARVEARIRELEVMLANVELIDESPKGNNKVVKLGSTVRILDLESNEEEEYTIVGSIESDPFTGRLSNISPLAMALMDHKAGQVVHVEHVDEPYDVKILELK